MINISISTNLLVIISCFVLLVIIGLIVYIIYKDRKVDQEEIDDLIEDIVKAKPRDTKPKEEIKVTKIESVEEPSKLNLEAMLTDMQSNLDKQHSKTIENYEKEQDENAIISIKELEKFANNNIDAYEKDQEKEAIISMKELSSLKNLELMEQEIKKPVKEKVEKKDKKFQSSEFISPIFGKMDSSEYPEIKVIERKTEKNDFKNKDSKHTLEQTLDVEPLSDEIKRNTDFLNALKEFRNNL